METQGSGPAVDSGFGKQQEQIKAGWSLLSTLHCVLLSEKVKALGSPSYKKLQVELLAVKWQDRCLQVKCDLTPCPEPDFQVRLAAQELLVAELKNLGAQVIHSGISMQSSEAKALPHIFFVYRAESN